jgi:predicted aldo/keto reductase-like oxidoreductase
MQYTTLGKTGLRVSRLGFGAMRLPMQDDRVDRELAIPLIHRAFAAGLNYVDTAVGYCNGDSQRAVGEALKGWRDRVVVSTKNPYYGPDEKLWWQNLEDSLTRLQVEYIDVYNTHGMNAQRFSESVEPHIAGWLRRARDQGLIRHIGTSFHDGDEVLRRIVDSGLYESITLQYNLLDRRLEGGIAHAHEQGLGIVVMGPVAGGRLGSPSEELARLVPDIRRIPELALRFVLANPGVDVALSGMNAMSQVEENLAVAADGRTFDQEETNLVRRQLDRLAQMADTFCTGCGYCQPCPEQVGIPRVFGLYNEGRVYGLREHAQAQYARWRGRLPEGNKQADACVECGICEEKCPQHLPIRAQLEEAHAYLTAAPRVDAAGV